MGRGPQLQLGATPAAGPPDRSQDAQAQRDLGLADDAEDGLEALPPAYSLVLRPRSQLWMTEVVTWVVD